MRRNDHNRSMSVDAAINRLKGFDRIEKIAGSTFRDSGTTLLVPTRGKPHRRSLPPRFVSALNGLVHPMNQKRALIFVCGDEVGEAYNNMIRQVLANPELSKWPYVMTIEDDNLVPPDAHIRLLETIEKGKYDAVSGLYFTKGFYNMPMAYGNPEKFSRTGVLDFAPLDVKEAIRKEGIIEVNGIGMGCALWRTQMFRDIEGPWFVTLNDFVPAKKGIACMTQDLAFCEKAKRAGKTFAVDTRVKVGHLDTDTGEVF